MGFGSSIAGIVGGAAGGNYVGGALVRLALDAAAFDSGLNSSQAKLVGAAHRLQSIGTTMSRTGSSMTRGLTIPIIAAGAASVKLAVDFETSFTRISAVSNASAMDIARWKKEVLELAGKTARAPEELADALYFLSSAGLKSSEIMPTLEASAKAAASGLGDTADIARLAANVLNAYAKSGITATEVTDTLVAAVKEGTAEPDEFANALGRILPIASRAKVGFDEVVASLAALSNIGLDVNEGVTAMRGLLSAIVAPGSQAAEALEDAGISTQGLRDTLARGGILEALQLLEDRTDGNIDKLKKIVPNIRGLTGELALTGDNADKAAGAFDRVADSTGALDESFRKTKKGPGFQFEQLLAQLKVDGIKIGRDLLPIVHDLTGVIHDLASSFSDLDPELRKNIVKWGLLVAALGPVVKLLGGVVSLGGGAVRILAKVGGTKLPVPGTPTVPIPAPAPVAGGAAAAGALGVGGAAAVIGGTVVLGGAIAAFVKIAGDQSEATKKAAETITKYGVESEKSAKALDTLGLTAEQLLNAADLDKLREQGKSYDSLTASEFYAAQAAEVLLRKHEKYVELLTGGGITSVRAYDKATHGSVDISDRQRRTLGLLIGAHEKLDVKLGEETLTLVNNALQLGDVHRAMGFLKESLDKGKVAAGEMGGRLAGLSNQAEIGQGKIRSLHSELDRLPKDTKAKVSVETQAAQAAVNTISAALIRLGQSIFTPTISIHTVGSGTYANKVLPGAASGAILAAASGFVARRPTVLVGEGQYSTPYGPGAEAVLPLNNDVLETLGRAIARAGGSQGAGGEMTINLILDGITLASFLTRHQKVYDIVLGGQR